MTPVLCSTCSSSLLPPKTLSKSYFLTACCQRVICHACLERNPRLREYDPCLACLAGVDATSSSSRGKSKKQEEIIDERFVLGDDEDDEDAVRATDGPTTDSAVHDAPPPYTVDDAPSQPGPALPTEDAPPTDTTSDAVPTDVPSDVPRPDRYYLKPQDTLSGLALRFGIDARRLARMNNLPPTTLSTTPHLLHTRRFITLPPSAFSGTSSPPPAPPSDLARERAAKRFAFITKQVDYGIAKAYVALVDDEDDGKKEELSPRRASESMEGRAVDSYLDDSEWEAAERRAGRVPRIPAFPYFVQPAPVRTGWFGK